MIGVAGDEDWLIFAVQPRTIYTWGSYVGGPAKGFGSLSPGFMRQDRHLLA